ncbi:hypothetical protein D3C81_937670 [compost metagenome]
MVYVFVVTPFSAVTTTLIKFTPTASGTDTAAPLATVLPFTFTVAPASATVGVTLIELTPLATLAV